MSAVIKFGSCLIIGVLTLSMMQSGCGGNMMQVSDYFSDPKSKELTEAAERGDAEGVLKTIREGADPNAKGEDGATPLMIVLASTVNKKGIFALLEGGANPNLPSIQGATPMILAARAKDPELLRLMLAFKGNPNALAVNEPILWLAARDGRTENVEALINAGANIDQVDGSGYTTVMNLVTIQRYDRVAWFIEKGANVHVVTRGGVTLAKLVSRVDVSASSAQFSWRQKVCQLLAAQGIHVTTSPH